MRTIVEYFGTQPGHRCGYCKSTDGNLSHGLWANSLTPLDYMDMLDRGWRRSGCYCYKPTMKETCCPQYTIRCDAPNFKLTRSQKRVMSIVNGFLLKDERPKNKNDDSKQCSNSGKRSSIKRSKICQETNSPQTSQCAANVQKDRSGKAKEKRKSRALKRWRDKNLDPEIQMELKRAKAKNKPKLLEERLQLPQGSQPKHELKIVLSCRGLENWKRYERKGHKIFKKYQMAIHGDGEQDCDWSSFKNFLIDHPFEEPNDENDDLPEYGAFHQQYLLDGKIIAVGVIDILPRCVSSKYLFYDPEYSFLSLGVYSALTEIALTRRLHEKCENLRWYYMGYYIHSCPKMTYKAQNALQALDTGEQQQQKAIGWQPDATKTAVEQPGDKSSPQRRGGSGRRHKHKHRHGDKNEERGHRQRQSDADDAAGAGSRSKGSRSSASALSTTTGGETDTDRAESATPTAQLQPRRQRSSAAPLRDRDTDWSTLEAEPAAHSSGGNTYNDFTIRASAPTNVPLVAGAVKVLPPTADGVGSTAVGGDGGRQKFRQPRQESVIREVDAFLSKFAQIPGASANSSAKSKARKPNKIAISEVVDEYSDNENADENVRLNTFEEESNAPESRLGHRPIVELVDTSYEDLSGKSPRMRRRPGTNQTATSDGRVVLRDSDASGTSSVALPLGNNVPPVTLSERTTTTTTVEVFQTVVPLAPGQDPRSLIDVKPYLPTIGRQAIQNDEKPIFVDSTTKTETLINDPVAIPAPPPRRSLKPRPVSSASGCSAAAPTEVVHRGDKPPRGPTSRRLQPSDDYKRRSDQSGKSGDSRSEPDISAGALRRAADSPHSKRSERCRPPSGASVSERGAVPAELWLRAASQSSLSYIRHEPVTPTEAALNPAISRKPITLGQSGTTVTSIAPEFSATRTMLVSIEPDIELQEIFRQRAQARPALETVIDDPGNYPSEQRRSRPEMEHYERTTTVPGSNDWSEWASERPLSGASTSVTTSETQNAQQGNWGASTTVYSATPVIRDSETGETGGARTPTPQQQLQRLSGGSVHSSLSQQQQFAAAPPGDAAALRNRSASSEQIVEMYTRQRTPSPKRYEKLPSEHDEGTQVDEQQLATAEPVAWRGRMHPDEVPLRHETLQSDADWLQGAIAAHDFNHETHDFPPPPAHVTSASLAAGSGGKFDILSDQKPGSMPMGADMGLNLDGVSELAASPRGSTAMPVRISYEEEMIRAAMFNNVVLRSQGARRDMYPISEAASSVEAGLNERSSRGSSAVPRGSQHDLDADRTPRASLVSNASRPKSPQPPYMHQYHGDRPVPLEQLNTATTSMADTYNVNNMAHVHSSTITVTAAGGSFNHVSGPKRHPRHGHLSNASASSIDSERSSVSQAVKRAGVQLAGTGFQYSTMGSEMDNLSDYLMNDERSSTPMGQMRRGADGTGSVSSCGTLDGRENGDRDSLASETSLRNDRPHAYFERHEREKDGFGSVPRPDFEHLIGGADRTTTHWVSREASHSRHQSTRTTTKTTTVIEQEEPMGANTHTSEPVRPQQKYQYSNNDFYQEHIGFIDDVPRPARIPPPPPPAQGKPIDGSVPGSHLVHSLDSTSSTSGPSIAQRLSTDSPTLYSSHGSLHQDPTFLASVVVRRQPSEVGTSRGSLDSRSSKRHSLRASNLSDTAPPVRGLETTLDDIIGAEESALAAAKRTQAPTQL